MLRSVPVLFATVLVAWTCPGTPLQAQEPSPARGAEGNLGGKFLILELRGKQGQFTALEQVQVIRLGGTAFIVGTGLDVGSSFNPSKGRKLWVPVPEVVAMIEFDNPDQVKEWHAMIQQLTQQLRQQQQSQQPKRE